ncbi:hypothetical protein SUGI_0364510 [Cryptomeria japonica]|nr:hypothetical protein SUGI_0364510 [Cryptomeria japonica]
MRPVKNLSCDVFHRSPEVKQHTLVITLYKMFNAMGMDCFWDSGELKLVDHLPGKLEAAWLHIAIFPDQHAQPWLCLADLSTDLAFMFKTYVRIVSIIYHVKSEGVPYAKGVSADAFHWSEKQSRYTPEKLQEWKNVLYDLSHNIDHILGIKEDEDRLLLKTIVYGVLKGIGKSKVLKLLMDNSAMFLKRLPYDFDGNVSKDHLETLNYIRSLEYYRMISSRGFLTERSRHSSKKVLLNLSNMGLLATLLYSRNGRKRWIK